MGCRKCVTVVNGVHAGMGDVCLLSRDLMRQTAAMIEARVNLQNRRLWLSFVKQCG